MKFKHYSLSIFLSMLCLMIDQGALAADKNKKDAKPVVVIVAPVLSQTFSDRIEALATARANESVTITANVTEKVIETRFEDGQWVEAGTILTILDHAEEQANLKEAEAVLGERRIALKRSQRLAKQKLTSKEELDQRVLAVEQAEATIKAIQSRINDRIIRAPFHGVVGLRTISPGTVVQPGNLITTLDDISVIKLDFKVPSVYLPVLTPGMPIRARATALQDMEFAGEVKAFESRVDPVTRTVNVRALLPNPEGLLKPGMLLQVELLKNIRQALVIQEAALLPQGKKNFVFMVDKDRKAQRVEVVIGTRELGKVEILQGLQQDAQVITHGNSKVKPGQAVQILAVDDGTRDIPTILKESKKTTTGK